MELKVSKEITCKRQNQRKICLLSIIFELAKPVRLNSFQKPYFQSVSIFFSFAHPWHLLSQLCCFNLPLKF